MKVFSLAMITLLLAALWTGSQGASFRSPRITCCYTNMFIKQKIHTSLIRSYQKTPSHCSHRAVRVELLNGRKFCVDLQERWFQQYLRQNESTNAST
ncbi:CCL4 protein, partial [Thinocorus orbignyianus]|nr:CCL4 protein [Thinocorus orbignyianus]